MAEKHIPGAAFVLVKDGELFLAKGYGLAVLAAPTPVNPETTLFGIASTTKLFTATAVMQLVERGLLELDGDVNQYLTALSNQALFLPAGDRGRSADP